MLKELKYLLGLAIRDVRNPPDSYSQHGEDLVLQRLLGPVKSFIDIGANDGFHLSNSYLFARLGAAGLCFEPVRSTYLRLRFFHLLRPRVKCINEAISEKRGSSVIQVGGHAGLLSTLGQTEESVSDESYKVSTRPLFEWIAKWPEFSSVDFVSIDVEGHELQVLRGIDIQRFKTRCFVVETDKVSHQDINRWMSDARYKPVLMNGLNTFYMPDNTRNDYTLEEICVGFPSYQKLC